MSQEFTSHVINSFGPKATPKARRLLSSLIQHIHDFTRENYITTDEWMMAVEFINSIGQISNEKRNEGILVSDVLGLEALVDSQTHSLDESNHTSSAILGPFYRENSPIYANGESIIKKDVGGTKCFLYGVVTDTDNKPLEGAKVEIWHCAPNGLYEQQDPDQPEYNLRGTFFADSTGYFSAKCLKPTSYPIPYDGPAGQLLQWMDRHPNRPSHIHWRVSKPEFHSLVTQIYDSECPYTKDDSVFAVKDDIIVTFKPIDEVDESSAKKCGTTIKQLKEDGVQVFLEYNIKLIKESELQAGRAKIYKKQAMLDKNLSSSEEDEEIPEVNETKVHTEHIETITSKNLSAV
ncbi:hypothetical protein CANARDRAFT_29087 [[Candida] arabinofermentans NRRL YB-2248]|uniref:Intradiol ring-cleavage dioxygenases domain-containing protein n=1 Tax=[Candida] arabinofermentans NRRL YB-2248 TaxID=983967 RepID=A0A1E4SYK8_9ASCO|nr:hypothetical protein CANARDRAFT_29087 [[Candida] arabinofermentans NRRL YB-2248]